jgi:hypothetical protein
VDLLASVSDSVTGAEDALAAVERGLAQPGLRSADRRAAAADLFFRPGGATDRSVDALYELIELEAPSSVLAEREARCQSSV